MKIIGTGCPKRVVGLEGFVDGVSMMRIIASMIAGVMTFGVAFLQAQSEKDPEIGVSLERVSRWVNQEWVLARLVHEGRAVALDKDVKITLRFMPNFRLSGEGPVNRYFGGFKLPRSGELEWSGPLGATKIAGDPEKMKLEKAFQEALQGSDRLVLLGEKLVFRDGTSEVRLEWTRLKGRE